MGNEETEMSWLSEFTFGAGEYTKCNNGDEPSPRSPTRKVFRVWVRRRNTRMRNMLLRPAIPECRECLREPCPLDHRLKHKCRRWDLLRAWAIIQVECYLTICITKATNPVWVLGVPGRRGMKPDQPHPAGPRFIQAIQAIPLSMSAWRGWMSRCMSAWRGWMSPCMSAVRVHGWMLSEHQAGKWIGSGSYFSLSHRWEFKKKSFIIH